MGHRPKLNFLRKERKNVFISTLCKALKHIHTQTTLCALQVMAKVLMYSKMGSILQIKDCRFFTHVNSQSLVTCSHSKLVELYPKNDLGFLILINFCFEMFT